MPQQLWAPNNFETLEAAENKQESLYCFILLNLVEFYYR